MILKHKLFGLIILIIGLLLIAMGEALKQYCEIGFVINFFGNSGTAFMAVGVIELIFKNYLQSDLIEKIISELKKERHNPFTASFLRRRDLSKNYDILKLIEEAKEEIIIKAVALRVNRNVGLFGKIEKLLEKNSSSLKVYIKLLNPQNITLVKAHCDFIGLSTEQILADSEKSVSEIEKLKKQYNNRISIKFYDSFPTTGIIMVDPKKHHGKVKIEFAVLENSSLDENINVVLEKRQDEDYFNKIYEQIK